MSFLPRTHDADGQEMLSEQAVRVMLLAKCKEIGGQAALARQLGISRSYLNAIIHGKKPLGAGMLSFLGLERVEYIREAL